MLEGSVEDLAKSLIEDALAPVADDLRELSRRMPTYIPTESEAAHKVVEHVFMAGGKRIRPALFFMCSQVLDYRGDHYFPIAAVGEFVHTASLLHDDVVDNSSVRRNRPTANSLYGDVTSVLAGDLIYSTASEMMAATGNMEIVRTFARAIRLMSDGELLQLENLFKPSMAEKTYLRILECKTATLIEAACKSAGLLANATDDVCARLGHFGHSVGMAFQLIDDALDYAGASDALGKATQADLLEGKITMPLILLRERASEGDLARLHALIAQNPIRPEHVQEVARLVEQYDTVEATVERAELYTTAAMNALMQFAPSRARDMLENLASKLLYRFH